MGDYSSILTQDSMRVVLHAVVTNSHIDWPETFRLNIAYGSGTSQGSEMEICPLKVQLNCKP
jgi:hypothetical protein